MKVANKRARAFVQNKIPFQGSNLYALKRSLDGDEWYVVYSYGPHWPLFVYANGIWFETADKCSITTTMHRGNTHPHCETVRLPVEKMRYLADVGYKAMVKNRVMGVA